LEYLEGEPPLPRTVVIDFPTMEQAKTWYDSPGYSKLRGIRQRAANTNAILVEGV